LIEAFKTLKVTQRLISFSNLPTVLRFQSLRVAVAFWHPTCFEDGA